MNMFRLPDWIVPLALLVCVLVQGCSFTEGEEDVHAEAAGPEVVVTNHTAQDVYVFAVGRRVAALINWAPQVRTGNIPPHESRSVSYYTGNSDEEELIVYWWHAVVRDGRRVPGEVNAKVIPLQAAP